MLSTTYRRSGTNCEGTEIDCFKEFRSNAQSVEFHNSAATLTDNVGCEHLPELER